MAVMARFAIAARGSVIVFPSCAAFFRSADVQRHALGDLLEPGAKIFDPVVLLALKGQRQENRLRRVFRVVAVARDLEADAEDHAAVTADDLLERLLPPGLAELD